MPSRRILVILGGVTTAVVAASGTAFGFWSSQQALRVAPHATATASPRPGAPFDHAADSPSASPTSPQGSSSSATSLATANGFPPPASATPNPNQARLGTDADGRPILVSNEVVPGHATEPGGVMTSTWKWDGSRWTWIRSDSQADVGGNLAYDPTLRKVVGLAGGITGSPYTMWGFDAGGWANLQPETIPSRGQDVALVTFDAAHKALVALIPETSTTSSTWTFDGQTWTRAMTAINPPPPHGASMAYDPVNSTIVLYGGVGNGVFDDTWTWDGATWTKWHPAPTPGACLAQLAYDAATSQMLLLCQGSAGVTMWSWTGTSWTQLALNVIPLPAWAPMMTYDAVRGELVYFGQPKGAPTSQTWTYSNGRWQRES